MNYSSTRDPWFAVEVTPRKEKQVLDSLVSKGYECLLPMQRMRRNSSGDCRESKVPLFPGYLFCQLSLEENRMALLTTPNLRNLVGVAGRPIPLANNEVAMLKRIVATGVVAQSWPYMREGDIVELVDGPLAGLRGLLVSVKEDSHLVVAIELLHRSIAVKIHPERVSVSPASGRFGLIPSPTLP
ncbi:MAG: transcriptional activator RfaH [Bryobacterales bacterium]|nr:transcriptional activator RfaH [Bryobacterales bacterium]